MSQCQSNTKNLLGRLQDLLEIKPKAYDVTFCVGPEEKKVRALKIILKGASPVFANEFKGKWKLEILKEGQEILLPEYDGKTFEMFIKLTMLDSWSLEALENLKLPPDQLLNLIKICRYFEMTEGLANLTKLLTSFFRTFNEFQKSNEFLNLSQEHLQIILSSDEIQLEEFAIFQAACRWAVGQCKRKNIETSGENLRQVLGNCLYEIRFPLMSVTEFSEARQFHNILTPDDSLRIYDFIGLDKSKRLKFDETLLTFKAEPRKHFLSGVKKLYLTEEFTLSENNSFVCNGEELRYFFIPNKNIELRGLGFLGPIDKDAIYDVTFRIFDWVQEKYSHEMRISQICAEKDKVFYCLLDQPIILEPREFKWGKHYNIWFSLKGPPTRMVQTGVFKHTRLQQGGDKFFVDWRDSPLAEILYRYI